MGKNNARDKMLESDKERAISTCKMLYRDISKPCTETCMCWGWEFGGGWNSAVRDLSMELEALNIMFHSKYGVHVVMDQLKEKYGTLRAYYHVEIDSPLVYRMWAIPFGKASDFLKKHVDFAMKYVVDRPEYCTDEQEEISEEEAELIRGRCAPNKGEETVVSEGGKWYRKYKLHHGQTGHMEPTKHKILYRIHNLLWKAHCVLDFRKEPSDRQYVIAEAVDLAAEKLVAEAERRCYNTCEDCGVQIGTEYSKRVETKGWISYICEVCDAKRRIAKAVMVVGERKDSLPEQSKETFDKIVDAVRKDFIGETYICTDDMLLYAEEMEEIADGVGN